MLTVFRRRNFLLLWAGFLISSLGDCLLITALPFVVYQRTGSVFAIGSVYIVETLPILFFGTFAGVFVDRWNRRRSLIVVNVLSAMVLLLLFSFLSGSGLWLVYVVAFVESLLAQFLSSAASALVPQLVDDEQLSAANAANAFSLQIARLIGPSLGGFLLSFFGLLPIVLVDSISFFGCAFLIFWIALPVYKTSSHPIIRDYLREGEIEVVTMGVPARQAKFLEEWGEGLLLVRKERLLWSVFLIATVSMLGEGFGHVVFLPFLQNVLHITALEFGWLLTVQGLGGVVGTFCYNRLQRYLAVVWLIGVSALVLGVFNFILILFPSLFLLFLVYLCGGLPVVFFFVGITTLLQRCVSAGYRGRIFGLYGTVTTFFMLVGMMVASGLAGGLDVRLLFGLMGGFYFLAGVVGLWVLA